MKNFDVFSLLVILIALMIFPENSRAQLISEIGISGGFTSAKVNVKEIDNFSERRSGFNGGVFIGFISNPMFSIVTGFQYSQRGFVEKMIETNMFGNPVKSIEANSRLDYISVPILIKIKHKTSFFEPYLVAGPRFDFLIDKENGDFNFTSSTIESKSADNFTDFTYGLSIGAGIKLPKIFFFVPGFELRYHADLKDSFSKTNLITAKNNTIDFNLNLSL